MSVAPATIVDTLGFLEWLIVLGPLCFLFCRLLGLRWMMLPITFCALQLLLVLVIALREHWRNVGTSVVTRHLQEKGKKPPGLQRILYNFFLSPKCGTDHHRPSKTLVKGASCWLFALPALDILVTYPEAGLWDTHAHEPVMLLFQCMFSFMADHVMVPHDSFWHPADRWSAIALTGYGAVKPLIYGLGYEDTFCSLAGVTACCIYFSQVARKHHGLPSHHVHHAVFHIVVASAWNYSSLCLLDN